jgi:hypothetical protein
MEQNLTGKAKAMARCHQKKWGLSREEWEMLEKLCLVLKVSSVVRLSAPIMTLTDPTQKYQEATLEFSTTTAPTICKVLPIYKAIQGHLKDTLTDPDLADTQNVEYAKLKNGVRAGLEKMDIHLAKALKGDYPLLSTGV